MSRCGKSQVPGSKFQVPGSRFQVPGFRFQVSGFRFQVSDFRFQISDFVVAGSMHAITRRFAQRVFTSIALGNREQAKRCDRIPRCKTYPLTPPSSRSGERLSCRFTSDYVRNRWHPFGPAPVEYSTAHQLSGGERSGSRQDFRKWPDESKLTHEFRYPKIKLQRSSKTQFQNRFLG